MCVIDRPPIGIDMGPRGDADDGEGEEMSDSAADELVLTSGVAGTA